MDLTRFAIDGQNTEWVAVSIERTLRCTHHAGIVYRDAEGRLWQLHFAWHRTLLVSRYRPLPLATPRLSAVPETNATHAMWLSTVCGLIAKHTGARRIPYNLKYDESVAFNTQTGEIIFGPNSTGLGCATFVLAVFRSCGNPLIDVAGWPNADYDDIGMQMRFVGMLLADRDPDRRAQGRRDQAEIGTKRIRPDHVAGACLEDALPVRHAECEANGIAVVALIDANAAPPAV